MILVGNIVQKSMLKKYSSKKQLKAIGYHQIMKNCPSPVLVFPYTLYCKGICFDENFGVGATFGACEETDLILEALDNKYQMCRMRRRRRWVIRKNAKNRLLCAKVYGKMCRN